MDLLSAQFHCGHLTLENIKMILGADFGEWTKVLKSKFVEDENGMFFNERIERELARKATNAENGKKGGRPPIAKPNEKRNNNRNNNRSESEIETLNNEYESELGKGKEKGGVGEKEKPSGAQVLILPLEEIAERLKVNQYETMAFVKRVYNFTDDQYDKAVDTFIGEKSDKLDKDFSEVEAHFKNWCRTSAKFLKSMFERGVNVPAVKKYQTL